MEVYYPLGRPLLHEDRVRFGKVAVAVGIETDGDDAVDSCGEVGEDELARLLGICFWREGLEAAFGPERRGEKPGSGCKS